MTDLQTHDSVDRDASVDEEGRMTLGEHLEELRWRLIYALIGLGLMMLISLAFSHHIIHWLEVPFRNAMVEAGYPPKLHVWEPTGAFMLYLKVSFYCGLLLSAPWILYQMWKFVAAGLYPHERRSITIILPAAGSLFIVGAAFCVLLIISPAVEFFVAFNKLLQVEPIITIGSYVKFVISLMLAFGLAFQTPLVIFVLARLGLVSVGTLRKYRKHVIIVILTLSAMLTPPDIFSQVALAVPIFLLYEVGVLLARWFGKPRLELDEQ